MGQARSQYGFLEHVKWAPVIAVGDVASIWWNAGATPDISRGYEMYKKSTLLALVSAASYCVFAISIGVCQERDVDYKYGRRGGLPEYCDPDLPGERKSYWNKRIGKTRGGLSHYCIGRRKIFEIKLGLWDKRGDSKVVREARLAIKGIRYWEGRIPKDHWMKGEIHSSYADGYEILGNIELVRKHRALAISAGGAGPDGGPRRASADAYVEMADRMLAVGVPNTAVELLELALKLEPGNKSIQRKLTLARVAAKNGGGSKSSAGK